MKRFVKSVTTLWVALVFCCVGNVFAQTGGLDEAETEALLYQREFAKFKWDIFELFRQSSEEEGGANHLMFTGLAADALVHLDQMKVLVDHYGLEDPVPIPYEITWWVDGYDSDYLTDLLEDFLDFVVWHGPSEVEILDRMAFFVEMNIFDLRQAITGTDKPILVNAYSEILVGAYPQLFTLVSVHHGNPFDYEAQLLTQEEVDEIFAAVLGENFQINPGLNDAWYEPATDGQGFFLSVYEEKGTIFLGWFTFGIEFPDQGDAVSLGDACQRWLTAHGPYDGTQAELVVYNSSGGQFDSTNAVPEQEAVGTIFLKFENCSSGSVRYALTKYGLMGEIPIQRAASDNVLDCEARNLLVR